MDYVSPISDLLLRLLDCCSNRASLVLDLDENTASLRIALDELKELREDTKRRVELSQQKQHLITKKQVEGWLQRAEFIEQLANEALQSGEHEVQSKCFSGHCPRNCYSSLKAAKNIGKIIYKVKEEIMKGSSFSGVAHEMPCVVVDEKPIEKTVGLESALEYACALLEDPNVGILGLYGMGGVGKTTLMTMINNKLHKGGHSYELVVWIVVSRQARVDQVQEAIFNRVNLGDRQRWLCKGEDERATTIYNIFKNKRFVLLLDDVWEHLDLLKVGIPRPNDENRCKIMFTTRSQQVCGQMEAHRRIKVTCLDKFEALTLFNDKVGEETLRSHPEIPSLAKIVASECDGLPLALITVGRAMSGKKDPREWRRAIEVLKSYPSTISGMGDHVFPVLKFSFDSLYDDTVKACFLYCSVFPEDYNIPEANLVELWNGEGFIDGLAYDIHEARNIGFDIVKSLKSACLLEVGTKPNTVKMHDVLRDMALWLASTNGTKRDQIVVEERTRTIDSHMLAKWNQAERVTLWGAASISESSSSFNNLTTLFIRDCELMHLPSHFFRCMPFIRVLDLSNSSLTELPIEIKRLVRLRYLNLSSTWLKKLPMGLSHLKQLRYLLLDDMKELTSIPPRLIIRLPHLRVLSMIRRVSTDEHLDIYVKGNVLSGGKEALLEELKGLECLNDLSINLSTVRSAHKLLSDEKLSASIRWLCLERCHGLTEITLTSSSVERMKNLEALELKYCCQLKQIQVRNECFANLSSVAITDCPMVDLAWLVYAPCLEFLQLQGCKSLEEVVSDTPEIDSTKHVFGRLRRITLFDLPSLKCIYPRTLPFSSLEEMKVILCPKVCILPFGSNTKTDVLVKIEGYQTWWEELKWDDENIKLTFQPFFRAF